MSSGGSGLSPLLLLLVGAVLGALAAPAFFGGPEGTPVRQLVVQVQFYFNDSSDDGRIVALSAYWTTEYIGGGEELGQPLKVGELANFIRVELLDAQGSTLKSKNVAIGSRGGTITTGWSYNELKDLIDRCAQIRVTLVDQDYGMYGTPVAKELDQRTIECPKP